MAVDAQLRAVADPTRRRILRLVIDRELPAGEISRRFKITRPAVSRHLRVLREAELVRVRRDGTSRYYRTDARALLDLGQWFRDFWDAGLPRLKRLAEAENRRSSRD